jgi:hypothetical protein
MKMENIKNYAIELINKEIKKLEKISERKDGSEMNHEGFIMELKEMREKIRKYKEKEAFERYAILK